MFRIYFHFLLFLFVGLCTEIINKRELGNYFCFIVIVKYDVI